MLPQPGATFFEHREAWRRVRAAAGRAQACPRTFVGPDGHLLPVFVPVLLGARARQQGGGQASPQRSLAQRQRLHRGWDDLQLARSAEVGSRAVAGRPGRREGPFEELELVTLHLRPWCLLPPIDGCVHWRSRLV